MRRRRLFVGIVIGLVATFISVSTAWAYVVITSTTVSPSVSGSSVTTPGSAYAGLYNGTAILSWTAPSAPSGAIFTYTISRASGQGSVSGTCTGTVSGTTCTDSGLTPGTSYTWNITAAVSATSWVSNTPATVTATAVGSLSKFVVSVSPSSITAGQTVTPTVTAEDSSSRVETGYTGTIAFSSSDGQAVFPSPNSYTFTTGTGGDDGTHAFTGAITLKSAPSQTITATDSGLSMSGTSSSVTVNPGPASQIVATSGTPQTTTVNTSFGAPLVAEVEDQYGNGVSGQTVAFSGPTQSGASATFLVNPSPTCNNTSGVSANSCSATTGSDGKATSSTVTANANTGSYNVTATSGTFSANFSLTNKAFTATNVATSLDGDSTEVINSGDTITVTYSEAPKASSVCASWSGTSKSITMDINKGSGANHSTLTIDSASGCSGLGSLDLGKAGWVTANTTLAASIAESGNTITITFGTQTNTATQPSGGLTLTYRAGTLTDAAGNSVAGTAPTETVASGTDAF